LVPRLLLWTRMGASVGVRGGAGGRSAGWRQRGRGQVRRLAPAGLDLSTWRKPGDTCRRLVRRLVPAALGVGQGACARRVGGGPQACARGSDTGCPPARTVGFRPVATGGLVG